VLHPKGKVPPAKRYKRAVAWGAMKAACENKATPLEDHVARQGWPILSQLATQRCAAPAKQRLDVPQLLAGMGMYLLQRRVAPCRRACMMAPPVCIFFKNSTLEGETRL